MCSKTKKIGIFDSGYGGLTILREIRKVLPGYDYLYLGDNARAPYGTHSFDVIYRYTLQAVRYLLEHECALVILACNTASAKALRTIQQRDLPLINARMTNDQMANDQMVNVLGVIRPTVEAVPALTQTGHVGILATPATVSSESYVLELQKVQSDNTQCAKELVVTQQSCPLWVPLIENGEHTRPGADYFVDQYLRQILEKDPLIDTLVLGCTHYPLLKGKIDKWFENRKNPNISDTSEDFRTHPGIRIVEQGTLVASSLEDYLSRHPEYRSQLSQGGTCTYLTTENADRFAQSASQFIGEKISAKSILLAE